MAFCNFLSSSSILSCNANSSPTSMLIAYPLWKMQVMYCCVKLQQKYLSCHRPCLMPSSQSCTHLIYETCHRNSCKILPEQSPQLSLLLPTLTYVTVLLETISQGQSWKSLCRFFHQVEYYEVNCQNAKFWCYNLGVSSLAP